MYTPGAGKIRGMLNDHPAPSKSQLKFSALGVSLIAIYENRFYATIGQNSIWHHLRKIYLPLMCIFPPISSLPVWTILPSQENARPCDETLFLENIHMVNKKIFILSVDPLVIVLWGVVCSCIITIPIISFFTLTFLKLLERQRNHKYSFRTIQMQKNFLLSMSIQFGSFLMLIIIPLILLHSSVIFWFHSQVLNNFITIMFSSFGTGSPVVMIFVYKPYRQFTLSIFRRNRKKESQIDTIQVQSTI